VLHRFPAPSPRTVYKLLSHVNKTHAIAMVALALVSVPISLFNLTHKFAVLTLINKPDFFTAADLHKQVLLQLEYYNNGSQREKRVVFSDSNVLARMMLRTALTNNNIAGNRF
jgi:hypothetical protein